MRCRDDGSAAKTLDRHLQAWACMPHSRAVLIHGMLPLRQAMPAAYRLPSRPLVRPPSQPLTAAVREACCVDDVLVVALAVQPHKGVALARRLQHRGRGCMLDG